RPAARRAGAAHRSPAGSAARQPRFEAAVGVGPDLGGGTERERVRPQGRGGLFRTPRLGPAPDRDTSARRAVRCARQVGPDQRRLLGCPAVLEWDGDAAGRRGPGGGTAQPEEPRTRPGETVTPPPRGMTETGSP